MTLNQILIINISLYIVWYEHSICARIPNISPDIRYPVWKALIRYDPDIQYLEPCYKLNARALLKQERETPFHLNTLSRKNKWNTHLLSRIKNN